MYRMSAMGQRSFGHHPTARWRQQDWQWRQNLCLQGELPIQPHQCTMMRLLRSVTHTSTLSSARTMAAFTTGPASSAAAPSSTPRVAVVGGGIAGLAAARALLRHNVAVALLDMGGRGVGGRVASRQLELQRPEGEGSAGCDPLTLSFDHGAQFFTAASPDFQREVAQWRAAGAVQEWTGRHGCITADGTFEPLQASSGESQGGGSSSKQSQSGFFGSLSGLPLYVGTPTNNSICQHLAQQLAAEQQQQQQQQQQQPQGLQGQQVAAEQQQQQFELLSGCIVQSVERAGGGCGCGTGGARWRLRGSRAGRGAAAAAATAAGQAGASAPAAAGANAGAAASAAEAGQQQQQQEDFGTFDAVVLADAMPLLPGSAGHVAGLEALATSLAQLARSVQAVAPQPCFALMLAFDRPLPGVPFDSAAVVMGPPGSDSGSWNGSSNGSSSRSSAGVDAFQWVACNSSKPGRPGAPSGSSTSSIGSSSSTSSVPPQCWVALTTPQRAQQLLAAHPLVGPGGRFNPQSKRYQAEVAAELLADFRALMAPFVQGPLPEPLHCHSQRWGRGFVSEPLGTEFLFLPAQRLALCGDVATGSGVEAAWRSGRAAGDAMGRMLHPLAADAAS